MSDRMSYAIREGKKYTLLDLKPITLEQAKHLESFTPQLYAKLFNNGPVYTVLPNDPKQERHRVVGRVRRVSKVKRWKRDTDRIQFSVKYGMYQTVQITNENLEEILIEGELALRNAVRKIKEGS